jgi:hypothetical protein
MTVDDQTNWQWKNLQLALVQKAKGSKEVTQKNDDEGYWTIKTITGVENFGLFSSPCWSMVYYAIG